MQNSGYKRSLTIVVNKFNNGVQAVGYPKLYDGREVFVLSYPNTLFPAITNETLSNLDDASYQIRLNSFKSYIQKLEAGLDFNTATSTNTNIVYDKVSCNIK